MGKNCLMGMEFFFGVTEMFWSDGSVLEQWWLHNIVNVQNVTELVHFKWLILC